MRIALELMDVAGAPRGPTNGEDVTEVGNDPLSATFELSSVVVSGSSVR